MEGAVPPAPDLAGVEAGPPVVRTMEGAVPPAPPIGVQFHFVYRISKSPKNSRVQEESAILIPIFVLILIPILVPIVVDKAHDKARDKEIALPLLRFMRPRSGTSVVLLSQPIRVIREIRSFSPAPSVPIDKKSLFRRHGHPPACLCVSARRQARTGLNERFHGGNVAGSGW